MVVLVEEAAPALPEATAGLAEAEVEAAPDRAREKVPPSAATPTLVWEVAVGLWAAPAPTADLSIVKTVASAAAVPGDMVTYMLSVNNSGPNTANSVTVTDTLPTQLTFVSCTESTNAARPR